MDGLTTGAALRPAAGRRRDHEALVLPRAGLGEVRVCIVGCLIPHAVPRCVELVDDFPPHGDVACHDALMDSKATEVAEGAS